VGKLKEVIIDIEDMLAAGFTTDQIEETLNCPAEWIAKVRDMLNQEAKEFQQ